MKGRGAGYDSQRAEGGEAGNDVLADPFSEVVLLGIAAHVLEGQDRYPSGPTGFSVGLVLGGGCRPHGG